ncbi:MAG: type IV secretion system DNA-binding domain-containing protein [Verrucomicrobia bacterium]|nr:type IV secretion system DNA-binding domain-containing protein [Verrucomicrobiota bacterium]
MDDSPSVSELLTRQFYAWERRGRGWTVWADPVDPEPPFRPFVGHFVSRNAVRDDGQEETILSRWAGSFRQMLGEKKPQESPPPIEEPEEPEPEMVAKRRDLIELQTLLPANLDISRDAFEQFLLSLSLCREPVTFELLGLPGQSGAQFAVSRRDASLVGQQLQAFFPEAVFQPQQNTLATAWMEMESAVVEFGLGNEFMLRLASGKLDPFVGIIGALAGLRENELGLVQVIFRRARQPWAESIMRAVMDNNGDAFFSNAPGLLEEARKKISRPLYAAVVRIATQSEDFDRTWEIARHLAGSLNTFTNPAGNELIPLTNDDYPLSSHVEDLLLRQSRRSGMLLNTDELIGFVHLPGAVVRSPKLLRETKKTKAAPAKLSRPGGVLLGRNIHQGRTLDVRMGPEERVRHMHVVGASGTGKSTLLLNCIRQDIENGQGVGVLDPHGDLVEDILALIPPERIDDVVLVDPADEEYSVGFNILLAHSDLEKTLLASDLVSIFQRLSTSWGDQMGSVLQNAILAFLESSAGGTLADMRRFLVDPGFRAEFLKTVADPDVVFYWKKTFPQLTGNRSIGPVLTRLETFLSPKSIRYMMSQPVNRLDFADILDSGKIFLAKLSQGQIGRENAFLLGSLMVAKFQQTAMSRQRMAAEARRDFWLYIDEFHNFITPSMAEILTGARKYRLGLTLAHQELRQLQRDSEVAGAVMSNTHTRVVFRVGDEDARKLGEGFGFFEAKDLQNLGTGEAIVRVERSDFDFNLAVPQFERPPQWEAQENRRRIIEASRKKYGTSRADIEAALLAKLHSEDETPRTPTPKPVPTTTPKDSGRKSAEVPKETVSKIEGLPADATAGKAASSEGSEASALKSTPESPPPGSTSIPPPQLDRPVQEDRGIGGHQHNLIRERIESVARTLGYYPVREKRIANGQKIDVALEKPNLTIACEISIMTTVDHEVGNVAKCLNAGCQHVAVICIIQGRLAKIQEAVSGCLQAEELTRVGYYTPDQFIAYLQSLASHESAAPPADELKLGKYKIKRRSSKLTPEEAKAHEAAGLKMLAETMRRKE